MEEKQEPNLRFENKMLRRVFGHKGGRNRGVEIGA